MTYTYQPHDEALRTQYNKIKDDPKKALQFAENLLKHSKYVEMAHIEKCANDPNCENMYEAFFLLQMIRNAEQRKEDRKHLTNDFSEEVCRIRNKIMDEALAAEEYAERDKHCNEYIDMLDEITFDLNTIASKLNNWRK